MVYNILVPTNVSFYYGKFNYLIIIKDNTFGNTVTQIVKAFTSRLLLHNNKLKYIIIIMLF